MHKWKIAVCGLGSIGSRHLRNLKRVLGEREEEYSVDLIRYNSLEIPEEFKDIVHRTYLYDDKIDTDYDVIFITNPTNCHYSAIEKYQWCTKCLFIEKPLFDKDMGELFDLNPECKYYIACPIRYKEVIQYVKEHIDAKDVLSAIALSSSYLPEWRPHTDYRKGYSAIKSMGGGVSLDLIHELDYLFYLFGMPQEIYNIRDKVSDLEIDSDDVSVYIAKLDKAIVQVHIDYIGRKDLRSLTLFTKDTTYEVNLLANTIEDLRTKEVIRFEETRDDFQCEELRYFFDEVVTGIKNENDIRRAYQTLKETFGRNR